MNNIFCQGFQNFQAAVLMLFIFQLNDSSVQMEMQLTIEQMKAHTCLPSSLGPVVLETSIMWLASLTDTADD